MICFLLGVQNSFTNSLVVICTVQMVYLTGSSFKNGILFWGMKTVYVEKKVFVITCMYG